MLEQPSGRFVGERAFGSDQNDRIDDYVSGGRILQRLVETFDRLAVGIIRPTVIVERNRIVRGRQAHEAEPHVDRDAGNVQTVEVGSEAIRSETADSLLAGGNLTGQIVLGLHVVGIMAVRADQHAVLRFLGQHPARVQPVVALAVHLRIAIEIGLELLRPFHALNSQKIFFGQLAEHRHLAQVDLAGHPLDVSADLYAVVVHRDARHLARVVFLQIDLDVGIELFLAPLPLGLQPSLFPLFLRIGSQPGIADTHRRRPRRIRNDQQAQIIVRTLQPLQLVGHVDREGAPSFGYRQPDHVLLDTRTVVIDHHDHELHAAGAEIVEAKHRNTLCQRTFDRLEADDRAAGRGRHLVDIAVDLLECKFLRFGGTNGQCDRFRSLGAEPVQPRQRTRQQQAGKNLPSHRILKV